MIKKITLRFFSQLDRAFRKIDREQVRRTKNIQLIPEFHNRRGGKQSYGEWAHVIGIFQTIIYQSLTHKNGNHILDIGSGSGLLGISSKPFVHENGSYTGIDVMDYDVKFCSEHYQLDNYHFIHFDVANPSYASAQDTNLKPWPVESDSKDLVTALSVWTHLREEDSVFYFKEIARVLKKGGKAIITFFYLDEKFSNSLPLRKNETGRFHCTNQMDWFFENQAYDSKEWYTPKWTKNPEDAIGISEEALKILTEESGLKLVNYYPGNWKEEPGVYFQDILVFEK